MAGALRVTWFERWGRRRTRTATRPRPIVASRDLPPLDPTTRLPLPRSPEPLPDEALRFARHAARAQTDRPAEPEDAPPLSIAEGADLRALLDRFRQASRRREALDQAYRARSRIVEQLAGGKSATAARPALELVGARASRPAPDNDARLDQAMEDALADALHILRRLGRPQA